MKFNDLTSLRELILGAGASSGKLSPDALDWVLAFYDRSTRLGKDPYLSAAISAILERVNFAKRTIDGATVEDEAVLVRLAALENLFLAGSIHQAGPKPLRLLNHPHTRTGVDLNDLRKSLFDAAFSEEPAGRWHDRYQALKAELGQTRTWVEFFRVLEKAISRHPNEFYGLETTRSRAMLELYATLSGKATPAPESDEVKRQAIRELHMLAVLWPSQGRFPQMFEVHDSLEMMNLHALSIEMTFNQLADYFKACANFTYGKSMRDIARHVEDVQTIYRYYFDSVFRTPTHLQTLTDAMGSLFDKQEYLAIYLLMLMVQGQPSMSESLKDALVDRLSSPTEDQLQNPFFQLLVEHVNPAEGSPMTALLGLDFERIPAAFATFKHPKKLGGSMRHAKYNALKDQLVHAETQFEQRGVLWSHLQEFGGSQKEWLKGDRGLVLREVLLGIKDGTPLTETQKNEITQILEVMPWLMLREPRSAPCFQKQPSWAASQKPARPVVPVGAVEIELPELTRVASVIHSGASAGGAGAGAGSGAGAGAGSGAGAVAVAPAPAGGGVEGSQ
jgi:hypothetical protein